MVPRREIVNAILCVLRTGCQWRYLPQEFPNWNTVYWYFARWLEDGTWEQLNDALRRKVRVQQGRDPDPSAAPRTTVGLPEPAHCTCSRWPPTSTIRPGGGWRAASRAEATVSYSAPTMARHRTTAVAVTSSLPSQTRHRRASSRGRAASARVPARSDALRSAPTTIGCSLEPGAAMAVPSMADSLPPHCHARSAASTLAEHGRRDGAGRARRPAGGSREPP